MSENQEHHLGYVLYPPRRQSEPGYARLEVWLSDQISGLHFDPLYLRVPVADEAGMSWQNIDHPYHGEIHLRLCAGPIDVMGFGEKRLEAFIFGGELSIERGEDASQAVLSSEAPILVRTSSRNASILLMEEAELILALRRGVWDEHPGEFDRRLTAAQPLELYHAILENMMARMKELPMTRNEAEQQFLHQLREEKREIEESGHLLRTLDEIL
jgi:hypothetical protein